MRRLAVPAAVGLAALLGVAACAGDPSTEDFQSQAEKFIDDDDGDLAAQAGNTYEDVECQEPASTDVDTTYTCSATGADGSVYDFVVTITGSTELRVQFADDAAAGGTTGTSPPTETTGG